MGYARLVIIAVLVVVHALFGAPAFLAGDDAPYLLRAAAYPFFHASWWHLAVNCLAIWTIFRDSKSLQGLQGIIPAFVISLLVYPLSFRPVIGFSNILYAAIGLRTPPLSSPWWRRKEVAVFLAVSVAMVVLPMFSATTHLAAFAAGVAVAAARRGYEKTIGDARRYL